MTNNDSAGRPDKKLRQLIDAVLRADAANDGVNDHEYAATVGLAIGRLRAYVEGTGQWSVDGGWDAREKLAWTLRYQERLKWHEVAERMDLSSERVRQLAAAHARALETKE